MCGIVGIINIERNNPVSEAVLSEMRDTMLHRGPDGSGNYLHRNVGLGHRRLSIIDLSGGSQPMGCNDNRLTITYNGEIYNYRAIRERLIAKGYRFKTNCDTEVILRLYDEKGTECVHELNGMFAFAIYDRKKDLLFLARDRLGIKPLYYFHNQNCFLFSSEIKAFLKHPEFAPELNKDALTEYLIFRCVSGTDTLFKNVYSLKPGHTLVFTRGHTKIDRYWSLGSGDVMSNQTTGALIERFDFLLNDSVKLRLMSDVPLGTFCSGGIDSSLVTAIAAKNTNAPINTFSVGFHEPQYDESEYATAVSRRYNTNHHQLIVDHERFSELLPQMIWQNDEPLNFANSIQIFAISELAKKDVTVVLTGEGSDELFWGYPRYQIPLLLNNGFWLSKTLALFLPVMHSLTSDHRIKKLYQNLRYSDEKRLILNAASLPEETARDLIPLHFNPGWSEQRLHLIRGQDPIRDLLLLEQQTYLLSILQRQDKMSMAAGIESRVPFLDHRIAEFAYQMPKRAKVTLLNSKSFVKKAARPYLPENIINRRKSGFGVPLEDWFRGENGMGSVLKELQREAPNLGIIDAATLRKMIAEHKAGVQNYAEALWTATNLLLWQKVFNISI